MKALLLYANEDAGTESRLQSALDMARAFDAHIGCVQVTPFDSFIMGDPFGGVYALPAVLDAVREAEDEHRIRLERGFPLRDDRSVSSDGNGRCGGRWTIRSDAMAEATLVEADVEASPALVDFLEAHGFALKAALWVYQSDAERWRFGIRDGNAPRRSDRDENAPPAAWGCRTPGVPSPAWGSRRCCCRGGARCASGR